MGDRGLRLFRSTGERAIFGERCKVVDFAIDHERVGAGYV